MYNWSRSIQTMPHSGSQCLPPPFTFLGYMHHLLVPYVVYHTNPTFALDKVNTYLKIVLFQFILSMPWPSLSILN